MAEKFLGGATKKVPKIAKKSSSRGQQKVRKIALLSLYYIFTMYKNPGDGHDPLPPAADAHVQSFS